MDVIFLGYKDIANFHTDDGKVIDGIKVFFTFESFDNNYSGFEVGHWFIDRSKSDLISKVNSFKPLENVTLSLASNGKRTYFTDINK